MARAALQWGVRDLAREAGMSPNTVARLERGEAMAEATLEIVRATFERAGVRVIDPDRHGGEGARFAKTTKARPRKR
jgi:transcriptional regulator with XRE-family HTH domain